MIRSLLLWASRNRWLREHLSRMRFVRRAVRRFMPGEELTDALAAAESYRSDGIGSVFTLLGENLTTIADADRVAAHYHDVIDEIAKRGLDGEISVKPTQLGLDLDPEVTFAHVDALARHAATAGTWVWVDMEGSAYTDATVALYERAASAHRNVGLCVQAYLRRTPDDLRRLFTVTPSIRLVKGAYDEPATIAWRSARGVDAAFASVATLLLEAQASGRAARVVLATHDTNLIAQELSIGAALGLARDRIEVTMLYGIRSGEQRRLAKEGVATRGLIAYGDYWYPWYLRRLAERPANVIFALRALLP
ncbi:MAG TPA: proline dehydrogenase family protein [Candidatus Limnocylindrales bacterium]|nr:proline dehydrogenase family protein [Candidatus Limnocylindrales bacterium]